MYTLFKDVTANVRCAECAWAVPTVTLLTKFFFYSSLNSKCVAAVSNKIFGNIHESNYASKNVRSSK